MGRICFWSESVSGPDLVFGPNCRITIWRQVVDQFSCTICVENENFLHFALKKIKTLLEYQYLFANSFHLKRLFETFSSVYSNCIITQQLFCFSYHTFGNSLWQISILKVMKSKEKTILSSKEFLNFWN